MKPAIIRNDDVAADTSIGELERLAAICDPRGIALMHACTPLGRVQAIDAAMNNEQIVAASGAATLADNRAVVDWLRARQRRGSSRDLIAVHGLWHIHRPSASHVGAAAAILEALGLPVDAVVPPFNERSADGTGAAFALFGGGRARLIPVVCEVDRLEAFLEAGEPRTPVTYIHSWRFERGPFRWEQLERCLDRLKGN